MKSIDDVGGRHPEFRDRKPDLPPLAPPGPDPPPGPAPLSPTRLLVGVCTGLGVLAVVAAVLFLLRRMG